MATVIDSITVKDTGWKYPSRVNQYTEFAKVNEKKCYALTDLANLCDETRSYAYQPSGGVSEEVLSPRVYCYDYRFNIPSTATILKVEIKVGGHTLEENICHHLLKLKIGTSITDTGAGYDAGDGNLWSRLGSLFRTYGRDEIAENFWGVVLTPTLVNNDDFGCVYQFRGTGEELSSKGKLRFIAMKVYYTQLGTEDTMVENTVEKALSSNNFDNTITADAEPYYLPDGASEPTRLLPSSKSIENIYDYMPFWIRFVMKTKRKNNVKYYKGAYYPDIIRITLNDCLRFENGDGYMEIPYFACWASTDEEDLKRGFKSYLVPVKVYPRMVGTGMITVTGLKYYADDDEEEVLTTRHFTINITDYYFEAVDSSTTLKRCTFNGCDAKEGKCIYNKGRLEYDGLTIVDLGSKSGKALFDYDKYRDVEL